MLLGDRCRASIDAHPRISPVVVGLGPNLPRSPITRLPERGLQQASSLIGIVSARPCHSL